MTIDGLPADIQFAGLARPNGADPVALTINGVPANQVTLPVGTQ